MVLGLDGVLRPHRACRSARAILPVGSETTLWHFTMGHVWGENLSHESAFLGSFLSFVVS